MADEPTHDDDATADADDDLLATPLDDTDLDARLHAAGSKGRARSTTVLAIIALLVLGFAVGALVTTQVAAVTAALAPSTAADDDLAESGSNVVGTVRAIDGDVVLVAREDGTIVRVTTSTRTQVASSTPADTDALAPGDHVAVTGTRDDAGAISARVVQQLPGR